MSRFDDILADCRPMKTSWDYVKEDIDRRERMGYNKYNKYLSKGTDEDMLQHLYEELMDATVYIKTLLLQRSDGK